MTKGLATYADAIEWLKLHWEPREIPVRLHTVQSEGWGLFFTVPFVRFLDAQPHEAGRMVEAHICRHVRNASDSTWDCPDCHGMGVYDASVTRFRYPMWRAMRKLSAHDKANPPRPGLPSMTECILGLVVHEFDGRRAARAMVGSTERGQWELAEPLFLLAIRRLFQRYEKGPVRVAWTDKSEAQQNAEVAA